jgi:thymidylate synthase ThyX
MKVVKASYEILTQEPGIEGMYKHIERVGRVCYKSEDKINEGSYLKFINSLINKDHYSVLEHGTVYLKIPCYFDVDHYRHNKCSVVNYNDNNYFITSNYRVIVENGWEDDLQNYFSELTEDHEKRTSVKFTIDRGCCYDKETEVLTSNGWKYIKDCTLDDEFYSLNDDNHIVFIKAKNIIKIPYSGDMHYYKTPNIDLLVTPNHNMWVGNPHTREFYFEESQKMNKETYLFYKGGDYSTILYEEDFKIPLTSKSYNKKLLFELFGWFLIDGHIDINGRRVIITEANPEKKAKVVNLLQQLGILYIFHNDDILFNGGLYKYLFKVFDFANTIQHHEQLQIPRVWLYDKECIISLLNGIIGGNVNTFKSYVFQTKNETFAKSLLEVLLLTGNSGYIKNSEGGNYSVVIQFGKQTVYLNKKDSYNFSVEEYDDMVYCVELEKYHKLFVLRNGRSCWCGNSHEFVRHRGTHSNSFTQESTRYVNYNRDKFDSEITVIEPCFFEKDTWKELTHSWYQAMKYAEDTYMFMIRNGALPQEARSVLPNSLKTELVMTCTEQDWKHFFYLRCDPTAHPQAREVAIPLEMEINHPTMNGGVSLPTKKFNYQSMKEKEQSNNFLYTILRKLEGKIYKYTKIDFDRELSVENIRTLCSFLTTNEQNSINQNIEKFILENNDKIEHIFNEYKSRFYEIPFLTQPEVFIIWFGLENFEFSIKDNWGIYFDEFELEQIQSIWGCQMSNQLKK